MMEKLAGELTLDIRFEFDLEDDLFEGCETVWEAVNTLMENREDLADLCASNKVMKACYEGFELRDPLLRE